MTVEEIKEQYSMRDIVGRYGIHINRAGFCSCPFHSGDRTPSMKIYPKDFHCHACGDNGDIFTFIQRMDNLTFKEVYYSLGGTYADHTGERPSRTKEKRIAYNRKSILNDKKAKLQEIKAKFKQVNEDINFCLLVEKLCKPFSDDWCWAVNRKEYLLYVSEELQKERKKISI